MLTGRNDVRWLYVWGIVAMLLIDAAACYANLYTPNGNRLAVIFSLAALVPLAAAMFYTRRVSEPRAATDYWTPLGQSVWNMSMGCFLVQLGGKVFVNGGAGPTIGTAIAGGFFLLFGGWVFVQGVLIIPQYEGQKPKDGELSSRTVRKVTKPDIWKMGALLTAAMVSMLFLPDQGVRLYWPTKVYVVALVPFVWATILGKLSEQKIGLAGWIY